MEKFNFNEQFRYEKAKKKANQIRGFYYHLACYCILVPVLIFINLTFVPQFHWFWFSMLGWGTGLLMHGLEVFGLNPLMGKNWEERKLNQFIEEEREKQEKINNLLKNK